MSPFREKETCHRVGRQAKTNAELVKFRQAVSRSYIRFNMMRARPGRRQKIHSCLCVQTAVQNIKGVVSFCIASVHHNGARFYVGFGRRGRKMRPSFMQFLRPVRTATRPCWSSHSSSSCFTETVVPPVLFPSSVVILGSAMLLSRSPLLGGLVPNSAVRLCPSRSY